MEHRRTKRMESDADMMLWHEERRLGRCRLRDIGADGAFLEIPKPPELWLNDVVELRFDRRHSAGASGRRALRGDGGADTVRVEAAVVRRSEHGVGVKFKPCTPRQCRTIDAMLDEAAYGTSALSLS